MGWSSADRDAALGAYEVEVAATFAVTSA
jgi:hypothetical protein